MSTPTISPVSLLDTIGRTPLLRLHRLGRTRRRESRSTPRRSSRTLADRSRTGRRRRSFTMPSERDGSGPAATILDATSGNTGIAYAMIAAARGYRLKLCVPGNVTTERQRTLRAYGAEVVVTDPMEGTDGAIREARRLQAESTRPVLLRRSVQQRRQLAGALRHDRRRDPRADRRPGHALRRRARHERHVHGHGPPPAGVPP